jgi:Kdo2-lipid IVA lauroyltransferase/acyltransferase
MQVIITIWKGICLLPAAWQKILGQVLGSLLLVIAGKRKRIAQVNIQACLPLLTTQEQNKLLNQNFKFLGASIFQTGSAWFWSDVKIQKHVKYEIKGLELLNNTDKQPGNLVLFKHSQHLELDARLLGLNAEIFGVARSHNSPMMNKLQTQGRLSSIQATADKNNPKKFLAWLKKGKNVLYAIDQDYGWENSVELSFFKTPAATITTARKIIDITQCNLLFVNSYFSEGKLVLELESINHDGLDSIKLAQKINDLMEQKITLHPEEYLWSHRRFKSTLGKNFYK